MAYNAGIAALNVNDYEEADEQFHQSVKLNPQDATAQMLLGYVLLRQEKWSGSGAATW